MHNENDVEKLLKKDGVDFVDFDECNQEVVSIPLLLKSHKNYKSWSRRLINTVNGSAVIISQSKGEGNRYHYHPDYNEWWYIVAGAYDMTIGKEKRVRRIEAGDFVFMEAGKWHQMRAVSDEPAVRIGFSHSMATHTYNE